MSQDQIEPQQPTYEQLQQLVAQQQNQLVLAQSLIGARDIEIAQLRQQNAVLVQRAKESGGTSPATKKRSKAA